MMKEQSWARIAGLVSAGLIVIAATGCDNVEWGGASLDVEAPASRDGDADSEPAPEAPAVPTLPPGDLLFFVSMEGPQTLVLPLAFVDADQASSLPPLDNPRLGPLLRDRLAGIKELTLFAEGSRAGTALVSEAAEPDPQCLSQPRFLAGAELRRDLGDRTTFLALPRSDVHREHGVVQPPAPVREVRAASLSLAGNIISEAGAVWPPSILGIRRDIRLFEGEAGLAVAASFLYRDRLDTSPPPAGSYSIFVMGEERPDSVHSTYSDFHRSGTDGKLAPRFLGQLDWDGDGRDEVVLELLSDARRGFRLLERTDDGFVNALEVTCASPSA